MTGHPAFEHPFLHPLCLRTPWLMGDNLEKSSLPSVTSFYELKGESLTEELPEEWAQFSFGGDQKFDCAEGHLHPGAHPCQPSKNHRRDTLLCVWAFPHYIGRQDVPQEDVSSWAKITRCPMSTTTLNQDQNVNTDHSWSNIIEMNSPEFKIGIIRILKVIKKNINNM